MLSQLIGVFDFPSFLVVAAICAVPTLCTITWLVRTPTDLERAKLQMDREVALANVERQKQVDIKKLDQNLITSHKRAED